MLTTDNPQSEQSDEAGKQFGDDFPPPVYALYDALSRFTAKSGWLRDCLIRAKEQLDRQQHPKKYDWPRRDDECKEYAELTDAEPYHSDWKQILSELTTCWQNWWDGVDACLAAADGVAPWFDDAKVPPVERRTSRIKGAIQSMRGSLILFEPQSASNLNTNDPDRTFKLLIQYIGEHGVPDWDKHWKVLAEAERDLVSLQISETGNMSAAQPNNGPSAEEIIQHHWQFATRLLDNPHVCRWAFSAGCPAWPVEHGLGLMATTIPGLLACDEWVRTAGERPDSIFTCNLLCQYVQLKAALCRIPYYPDPVLPPNWPRTPNVRFLGRGGASALAVAVTVLSELDDGLGRWSGHILRYDADTGQPHALDTNASVQDAEFLEWCRKSTSALREIVLRGGGRTVDAVSLEVSVILPQLEDECRRWREALAEEAGRTGSKGGENDKPDEADSIEQSLDLEAYFFQKRLLEDFGEKLGLKNDYDLKNFLKTHPKIRTHKPNPQRFMIHYMDFKYAADAEVANRDTSN